MAFEGRGNVMLDQADLLDVHACTRDSAFFVPLPGAGSLLNDGLAGADLDQILAHVKWDLKVPNPLASCRRRNSKISEVGMLDWICLVSPPPPYKYL